MTICSFCSLLCEIQDDSLVDCNLRQATLDRIATRTGKEEACIDGRPVPLQEALDFARQLIIDHPHRVITGRIRSVEAARAAIALASQLNAFIDPTTSCHAFKNIKAVQRSGMIAATLSEVRFRSDCILLVGDDRILERFPRLLDILLTNHQARRFPKLRRIIAMGSWSENLLSQLRSFSTSVCSIETEIDRIPQALLQWSRIGIDARTRSMNCVSKWIAESRYLTVVWGAAQLQMLYPDLWIERLYQWMEQQNVSLRCVGFPLADEYVTFQQTCTWITGFPGRVQLDGESFQYEPHRDVSSLQAMHPAESMTIQIDESFSEDSQGAIAQTFQLPPTILVAPKLETLSKIPRVFLPCAISGVDVPATFFRLDGAVAMHVDNQEECFSEDSFASQTRSVVSILDQLGTFAKC